MTPIKTLVCGMLAASFCATALAQVPPVGVADQQAERRDSVPEDKNRVKRDPNQAVKTKV